MSNKIINNEAHKKRTNRDQKTEEECKARQALDRKSKWQKCTTETEKEQNERLSRV